ncbi:hypothetical protein L6452_34094 [Arctium lappa]|uniref:Uncharacterized protein n=1 Tax=Arctium lappa TaxID=4217 RepID=A0ACB8YHW9_ARCLA|nr:hypothetical protein L6452_34094 [Arctium lappa]
MMIRKWVLEIEAEVRRSVRVGVNLYIIEKSQFPRPASLHLRQSIDKPPHRKKAFHRRSAAALRHGRK